MVTAYASRKEPKPSSGDCLTRLRWFLHDDPDGSEAIAGICRNMQTRGINVHLKRIKLICSTGMFVLCLGITMSSLHADQGIQAGRNGRAVSTADQRGLMKLTAGGNPAVCKANYDQCIKGCGGFAQCNNQCAANYRGCLGQ